MAILIKKNVIKIKKSILNLKNNNKKLNLILLKYWKKF